MTGHWIQPGTKPQRCAECPVPVYRVWAWDDKAMRQEFTFYDCESAGNVRPTKRNGGTGQIHIHQAKAAA